jgi:hypothetical protein
MVQAEIDECMEELPAFEGKNLSVRSWFFVNPEEDDDVLKNGNPS